MLYVDCDNSWHYLKWKELLSVQQGVKFDVRSCFRTCSGVSRVVTCFIRFLFLLPPMERVSPAHVFSYTPFLLSHISSSLGYTLFSCSYWPFSYSVTTPSMLIIPSHTIDTNLSLPQYYNSPVSFCSLFRFSRRNISHRASRLSFLFTWLVYLSHFRVSEVSLFIILSISSSSLLIVMVLGKSLFPSSSLITKLPHGQLFY